MDQALNTLLREPKALTIGGQAYSLRPLTVRDVPFVSRLLRDVWNELVARPDLTGNREALLGWLLVRLPELLETKVEDTLALLARQTGKSADELGDLPLDLFLELGAAALEDAIDFFTHQVIPALNRAADARGTGAMPTPPSSPPDTGAPNLPTTP